jgi:dienelactone hydrolase
VTLARERVFTFGLHRGLVGVLAEPADGPGTNAPAILLYNVGLNHRVGPFRLNVDIARHLAAAGYTSLRFDLSGLGDSLARNDGLAEIERGTADVREAMEFVTNKCGIDSFVIIGLCSGVDTSHPITVADRRIKGTAFIDGYSYQTLGYRVRRALMRGRRLLSPRRYKSWLDRRLHLATAQSLEIGDLPEIFDREYPPIEQFRADIRRMLARETRLLFINTGSTWFYNHRDQFKAILHVRELPPGLEVEYWPDSDHVFTATARRTRLVNRLADWVQSHFPPVLMEALVNLAS